MAKNEYFIRVGAELDQSSVDKIYDTLSAELSKSSKKFNLQSPQIANADQFRKQIAAMMDASGEIQKVFASLKLQTGEGCDEVVNVVVNKLSDGVLAIDDAWSKLSSHGINAISDLSGRIVNGLKSKSFGNMASIANTLAAGFGDDIGYAFANSVVQSLQTRMDVVSDEYSQFVNNFNSGLNDNIKIIAPKPDLSDFDYDYEYVEDVVETEKQYNEQLDSVLKERYRNIADLFESAKELKDKLSATKFDSDEYNPQTVSRQIGVFTRERNKIDASLREIALDQTASPEQTGIVEDYQDLLTQIDNVIDGLKTRNHELRQQIKEATLDVPVKQNKSLNTNPFQWYTEIAKKQLDSSNKLVNNINSIASTDVSAINRMDKSASSQHNAIEESRTKALTRLDELGGTAKLSEEQVKAWEDLNNLWSRAETNISNATTKLAQLNAELQKSAAVSADEQAISVFGKAVGQNVGSKTKVTYLPGASETHDKDDIRRVNMLYAQYEQTLLEIERTQRNITLMQEQGQDTSKSRIALQAAQDQLDVIEKELYAYQDLYNEQRLVLLQDKVANQISKESRQALQASEKNDQSGKQVSDLNTLLKQQRSLWSDIEKYKAVIATADANSFQSEAANAALNSARAELDLIQEKIAASDVYGAEEKQRAAQEIANAKEVSAIRQQTIKDGAALDKIAAKEATTVAQEAERGFKNAERLQQTVNKLQSQFDDQQVRAGALNVGPENLSGLDDGIKSINTDLQEYRKLLSEGNIGQAKILWDDIKNSVTLTDQAVKDLNESLSQVEASHSRLDELAKKAYAAQATAGSIGGYSIRQEDGNVVQAELNERAALAVQLYREELDRLGYTEEEWLARNNGVNAANEARAKALSDVTLAIKKQEEEQRRLNDIAEASQVAAFQKQIGDYLKNNTLLSEANKSSIQDMLRSISASAGNLTRTELEQMSQKFNEIRINAKATGKEGTDAFTKIGNAFQKFGGWSLVTRSLTYARRLLVQLPKDVKELESALANFSIVTGATGDRLNRLADSAYDAAQKTKSSVTDVLDAATVYARLGFSDTDSVLYSQLTAMFSKVGNVDVSDAENAVTAMIKAFDLKTSELELALDKMVAVGNNAPISAAQLGEGFNNAAAALSASGNTLEQSIGMLTAANATLQNASQASTALRTITARLRNSKADLEELGEATDDLATSTAKYRKDLMSLTGIDIMANENDFKSTYEILDELAEKWGHLSDINKASVTTLVAGTRQQAVFASLMQNWDEARKAVELCDEAGGTMNDNYSKYTNTIEARITGLKTSFSQFANTILSSGLVGFFVSAADGVVKFATALGKVNALAPLLATGVMTAKNSGFVKTYRGLDGSTFTSSIFDKKISNDDVAALELYNDALSKIDHSQDISAASGKAFSTYLSHASSAAKKAAVDAKGASVNITALAGAEKAAATAGAVLKSVVGNMLISLAISVAIAGITKLFSLLKEAMRSAEEKIKDLSSAIKEITERVDDSASAFRNLKSQTDNILPRYKELAKGVGKFGKNISLSDEEFREYISLQNQLAQLFPDLQVGWDENGNAILSVSENVDTLTEAINGLIAAEREAANQKIAEELPTALENAAKQDKQYKQLIKDTEESVDSINYIYNKLLDVAQNDSVFEVDSYIGEDFLRILKSFGMAGTYNADSESYLITKNAIPKNYEKVFAAQYQSLMDGVQHQIESYNARNKSQWKSLNPIIAAWLETDWDFTQLNEDAQNAVTSIINQIDFSAAGLTTEEAVKSFIKDNIVGALAGVNATEEVKAAFTNLFTLDPADITVGQYQAYVNTLVQAIRDAIQKGLIGEDVGSTIIDAIIGSVGDSSARVDALATRFGRRGDKASINNFVNRLSNEEYAQFSKWDTLDKRAQYDTWSAYKQAYLDYVNTTKTTKPEFDFESWFASFEKLNDLRDAVSAVSDDMSKYGELQTATIDKLKASLETHGLELGDYLSAENGKITANTDALVRYITVENGLDISDYVDDLDDVNQDLKLALSYERQRNKEISKRTKSSFAQLDTASSKVSVLNTTTNELRNGNVSYSTLSNLSEQFENVSGIDKYIETLARAQSESEETASIISTLLSSALIDAFGSTQQLADADETLVAKMLEANGVLNANAVAHDAVTNAKNASAFASKMLAANDADTVQNFYNQAMAAGVSEEALTRLIMQEIVYNGSSLTTSGSISNLLALIGTTDQTIQHLQLLVKWQQAVDAYNSVKAMPTGNQSVQQSSTSRYDAYEDTVTWKKEQDVKRVEREITNLLSQPLDLQLSDLQWDLPGGGGGSASTAADNIMESYNNLNAVLEHCIRLQEEAYVKAERNHNYDGMKKSLQEQVGYYQKIQDAAHTAAEQLRAYYRSQGMDAATIEQQSDIMGLSDAWTSAAESIRNTLDKMATAIRDKLNDMIDDVQSAWDNLSKAAEEYSETGTISVDTLQAIISSGIEYVALLKEENGQLVLNDDALADVLEAKTEQLAIESALGYIQEVRNALTEQNTNELQRLLDVTQMTTDSTWGLVDAQLASLRASGLSDEQYNQLVSNINKFRSIADTSIKSIRTQIKNSRDDTLKNTKDALDDMLKYVEDMIKWEHDKMIEAIEDESDAYQDLIDKKKELLKETKNEQDYEKEVAKQLKEIAKIQNQINLLSLDDSREGKAKKAELEQQLAELQTGLTDYISDYTLQKNEETLDKSSEDYQKYNEDRIKAIQDEISSEQKLYELAISRIDSEYENLLSQVLAYNREAGNSIEEDIVNGWNNAIAAIRQYGSYAEAVSGVGAAMSLGDYNTYSSVDNVSNADVNAQATDIVSRMKANSAAWHNASDADKAKLDAENVRLASQLEAIINKKLVRSRGGTWYIGSENGPTLYSVYHSGGIVGNKSNIKQDETLALLQNGEMVATKKMQNTLFSMVDFIDSVSAKLRAMTNGNSITSLLSNNTSVLKSLQPAIAGASSSFVFEPHIEVNITSNGPMSDDEVRGYGEQIANTTLSKLSEAFTKKGMNSFGAALLRG